MADDLGVPPVIHGNPPQASVIKHETAGLDDIHRNAEAGRQTENRSGVLRDIRLIKGDTHDKGIPLRRASRNHACFQRFQRRINDAVTI